MRRPRACSTTPPSAPRYLNRELSWLDFNERVLALAERRRRAAARAGQVPRHLQPEPRRVLPGPGGRASRSRCRPGSAPPRPTGAPPASSSSRCASGSRRSSSASSASSSTRSCPALAANGVRLLALGRPRRGRREVPGRDVRAADLPGAHAARRRPRPPVPLHLQPVAEPGGARSATRSPASGGSPGSRCRTCCPGSWSCPTASASCRSSR